MSKYKMQSIHMYAQIHTCMYKTVHGLSQYNLFFQNNQTNLAYLLDDIFGLLCLHGSNLTQLYVNLIKFLMKTSYESLTKW